MADRPALIKVSFRLPAQAGQALDVLVADGRWGHDRDDAARTLLLAALRDVVTVTGSDEVRIDGFHAEPLTEDTDEEPSGPGA